MVCFVRGLPSEAGACVELGLPSERVLPSGPVTRFAGVGYVVGGPRVPRVEHCAPLKVLGLWAKSKQLLVLIAVNPFGQDIHKLFLRVLRVDPNRPY